MAEEARGARQATLRAKAPHVSIKHASVGQKQRFVALGQHTYQFLVDGLREPETDGKILRISSRFPRFSQGAWWNGLWPVGKRCSFFAHGSSATERNSVFLPQWVIFTTGELRPRLGPRLTQMLSMTPTVGDA